MLHHVIALSASLLAIASAARGCGLALVLAVDVSGSVDPREFRIQMDGLAAAMRDGIVVEALVDQRASVTLIQWTGTSRQRQTIPWTAIETPADVLALADRIGGDPRIWQNYSTAIGEALSLAIERLEQGPDCRRRVIDVSGDGPSNEGTGPKALHPRLREMKVTVNALAIETDIEEDLTGWFYENLITGDGAFVITANGFADYPEQIRRKLQREVTRQISVGRPYSDHR
ncbi:DUF1194 domain-containing protein [Sulfitobacter sp. LCG007]